MKHPNKIIIFFFLIIAILFIPFYPVKVVPEWKLTFLDKENKPIPKIRINQVWRNYSLESLTGSDYVDANIYSNSDGQIKLPERKIRVSLFQLVISPIRNIIVSINPHASFGSHSYIVCQGKYSCVVSYDDKIKQPQTVNVW